MAQSHASRMVEDYLKIIWKAQEWPGRSVSTNEIAAVLGVTPSSVSANLKKLARDGFIDYQPYGSIELTPAGREVAIGVVRRHRLLETYLVERLGLGWDEVHPEADALEHAVSDLVLARMDEVLGYPERDPHGDSIPRADGSVVPNLASRLSELLPGDEGRVVRISDQEPAILRYLEARRIRVGTRIRVVATDPEAGSVSVVRGDTGAKPSDGVEIALGAADVTFISVAPR